MTHKDFLVSVAQKCLRKCSLAMWRRKRRRLKRRRSFCWIVSQVAIRPSSAKRCFNFFHQRIPSWPHDVSNSTGCKALQRKRKWSFPTKHKTCSTLDGKECVSAIEHLLKRLQAFSFAQKYKFPCTRAQHNMHNVHSISRLKSWEREGKLLLGAGTGNHQVHPTFVFHSDASLQDSASSRQKGSRAS